MPRGETDGRWETAPQYEQDAFSNRSPTGVQPDKSMPEADRDAGRFSAGPEAVVVTGIVLGAVGGALGVTYLLAAGIGALGATFAGVAAALDRKARRVSAGISRMVQPVQRRRVSSVEANEDPIVAAVQRQARAAMSSRASRSTEQ